MGQGALQDALIAMAWQSWELRDSVGILTRKIAVEKAWVNTASCLDAMKPLTFREYSIILWACDHMLGAPMRLNRSMLLPRKCYKHGHETPRRWSLHYFRDADKPLDGASP